MSRHSYHIDEEPEVHQPDLDPEKKHPILPEVRMYAILFTVFLFLVVLKQNNALDWSWWWVSLPLWVIPAGYGVVFFLVFLIGLGHELKRALHR